MLAIPVGFLMLIWLDGWFGFKVAITGGVLALCFAGLAEVIEE